MKKYKHIWLLFILMGACAPRSIEDSSNIFKEKNMNTATNEAATKAPELRVDQWIDAEGNETAPIRISQFDGKFKVIYCFQHWCPGCHSVGLPSLQKLTKEFSGNDEIVFMAIQTVFEGAHTNTYDRIRETQIKYNLHIPFGHDPGEGRSTVMEDYQTGGTPWFILIDQNNDIVFADFHINVDGTVKFINDSLKEN